MLFPESPNPKPKQKKPAPEGFFDLDFSSSSSMGMALPNLGPFSPPSVTAAAATNTTTATSLATEDPSKKVRKPYTITKSRESWTDPEHDKFLEALHLFDRDWKKIEAFIGSKTVIQIRSHAQKYFLKVQKSGTNEHLPPPRPKRKASHPYPQKASKTAPVLSQVAAPFQASPILPEPGFALRPDSSSTVRHAVTGPSVPSGTEKPVQTASLLHVRKGEMRSEGQPVVSNFYGTGNEIMQKTQSTGEMNNQGTIASSLRVLPDFAQVYSFIGSVFDPNMTGHLQKLKKMDRIDVETVLLLMRNLSINLTSPDFENHRRLLSSCEIDLDKDNANGTNSAIHDVQSEKIA